MELGSDAIAGLGTTTNTSADLSYLSNITGTNIPVRPLTDFEIMEHPYVKEFSKYKDKNLILLTDMDKMIEHIDDLLKFKKKTVYNFIEDLLVITYTKSEHLINEKSI